DCGHQGRRVGVVFYEKEPFFFHNVDLAASCSLSLSKRVSWFSKGAKEIEYIWPGKARGDSFSRQKVCRCEGLERSRACERGQGHEDFRNYLWKGFRPNRRNA